MDAHVSCDVRGRRCPNTYATTANIDLYAFLVSLTCTGKSNARAIVMYFLIILFNKPPKTAIRHNILVLNDARLMAACMQ